jgi:arylsulfatase A-like enzyme
MVASLDDGIGKVLNYLDEKGLTKNTIVIFMSDHGGDPNYGGDNKPLRDGKATLFDGGIKIPCIVRWPGQVEAGTVNNDLAWSLDWFPTLASLSNVQAKVPALDGQNIADLLVGKKSQKEREMYWELGNHAELDRGHWMAYRKGNWKYVTAPKEGEWLFDLSRDPFEKNNLKDIERKTFNNLKHKSEQLGASYKKFSEEK